MPTSAFLPRGFGLYSATRLQYQRPRASWENEPDLIRPSVSRCFQSRILQPLNLTIAPVVTRNIGPTRCRASVSIAT
jgi:hypothetical protein